MNKSNLNQSTNNNKWKANLQDFSSKIKQTINRFKNNKDKVKFLIPIAIISSILMIYMIVKTIMTVSTLNKESKSLYQIKNFNLNVLENNDYTKERIKNSKTINDLINYEIELSKEIEKYNHYLSVLQSPYSHFMKYILLPELNIWKDPFTNEIDTNLIGIRYLEKNPYNDIKLIQKRSDFIKNVWANNEFNKIESIVIWDIIEEWDNFHIPMNIKFISNSKRSFLLLVEKLSITSNQKNISLINEFIYNLRKNIKENKIETIEKLKTELNLDEEKVIWYSLYKRIFSEQKNDLLNDEIINKTIRELVVCEDSEKDSLCFYKFRDKYRAIPSLAYTIGVENNKNKTEELKKFLNNLAPIIKINTFTFERHLQQDLKNFENIQYKWEIQMDIYGKGISDEEVDEIAEKLWEKCINEKLSPEIALKKIENTLINIWDIVKVDTKNTSNLRELKGIIENIEREYNNLSNNQKIIKLFEIYRMMNDNNLCQN